MESLWQQIDQTVQPLPPRRVPLAYALGRVLTEPALAETDQPPFDRAAMDGYLLRAEDAGEQFAVLGEIRPGHRFDSPPLTPGQAYRIFTGAEIPFAGSRVVMQEHFARDGATVRLAKVSEENHVRLRGADSRAGDLVVPAGTVISPGIIAILAANGYSHPLVVPAPTVAHVTTGDEIATLDAIPAPGQIRDSNGPLIRALASSLGVTDFHSTHAAEDRTAMDEAIAALGDADLLLISGGASVGDHDFTRSTLAVLGFTIHCGALNLRPGKPLIYATVGSRVAFGIPGNPVSHLVCFHLFIARVIARLSGKTPQQLRHGNAIAPTAAANTRVTWWPSRAESSGDETHLHLLPWNNSGDLSPLAAANALVRIPSGTAPANGERLVYLPIS